MGRSRLIRTYLVPAGVFQAVIFGGAYGTGREIAEFVSSHGPVGGLLACALIATGFSLLLVLSFEVARVTGQYEYRGFLSELIGRGAPLFDCLFAASILLVLAVNVGAATTLLDDAFGVSRGPAILFVSFAVAGLAFAGHTIIERSLTFCALTLTVLLATVVGLALGLEGSVIRDRLAMGGIDSGWPISGAQYVLYNSAVIPIILYSARELETRSECFAAAAAAGAAGAFPAVAMHVAFMARYPEVVDQPMPTYWMIEALDVPTLPTIYAVVFLALVIQTAVGLLHGLNERIETAWRSCRADGLPPGVRGVIAGGAIVVSVLGSEIGLVKLVAQGYGNLAWGYLAIYILPLVVVGSRILVRDMSYENKF